MGCNNFQTEQTDKLVEASLRGENSGIQSCSPEIREEIEKITPEVKKTIAEKLEEYCQRKVEEKIGKSSLSRETENKLTPERARSLFTKEYNEWRREVRDKVFGYRHHNKEEIDEKGNKTLGSFATIKGIPKGGIETFKQSLTQAKGTLTHEFAEVDYKTMSTEEQQHLNQLFLTTNRDRELEFFKGELYGANKGESNPYALKDAKENYCFWRVALKHETEERKKELKEINPAKFEFCKERDFANELEVQREKLEEGGIYL